MSTARQLLVALALMLLALRGADAQPDDSAALITILETKPEGMETATWKEKRRAAAVELGRRKDPKAVAALIRVVRAEEFDIVAEHAMIALGKIGDPTARAVLEQAAADKNRDADARRAARKALDALGGSSAGDGDGDGDGNGNGDGDGDATRGGRLFGESTETPKGPRFADDAISVSERLVFALGDASFTFDTIRETPSFQGNAAAEYVRREERERLGLDYGARAAVAAGGLNAPGAGGSSQTLASSVTVDIEARAYFGTQPLFVFGGAALGLSLTVNRIIRSGADDTREKRLGLDGSLRVGAGMGRIIERGQALRVARIELVLKRAKLLGRPITGDLAEKLLSTWWALRGDRSTHRQLVATIAILRDAGVLLEDPSASTVYKILNVLGDGRLASRPEGFAAAVGISETFIVRDDALELDEGRAENVIARARYGKQQTTGETELVGSAAGRFRVLAAEDGASPWLVAASAALRRTMYNDTFDSLGALEVVGEVGASDDGGDNSSTATRVGGTIGWIFSLNRASQVRIAAEASFESSELFVGATLSGSYGFLDVSFVGKSAY